MDTTLIIALVVAIVLAAAVQIYSNRKKKKLEVMTKELQDGMRKIRYDYEQILRTTKRTMVRFFEREESKQIAMGITDVSITIEKDGITVYVQLERPGLLIGKGGRTINALERELTEEFQETQGKKVSVKIIEEKMWQYKSMEELPSMEELTISEDRMSFKEFEKISKGFY